MIKEEQFICRRYSQTPCNKQLADNLKVMKNEYESSKKAYSCSKNEPLPDIYKSSILSVDEIPMVKKQIDAVKTYQEHCLNVNEQNVNMYPTHF